MNIARTQIDTASVFALKKKLDECGFELDHERKYGKIHAKDHCKKTKTKMPLNCIETSFFKKYPGGSRKQ